jgi:hypothetical protein
MKSRNPSLARSRFILIGLVATLVVIAAVQVLELGRVQTHRTASHNDFLPTSNTYITSGAGQ